MNAVDLVDVELTGEIGVISINRPERINAINPPMIYRIAHALEMFRDDSKVRAVLIEGRSGRGLCAGGDLQVGTDGIPVDPVVFLRRHYGMDAMLSRFPKPVVSFMDGIVMGGGVGLGAHVSYRIVTERSRVAMPETRIGLTPDVGGTYLLSRAPGLTGLHLGLGSVEMGAADAIYAGFADWYVAADRLETLREALIDEPRRVREVIASFAERPPAASLARDRAWIDHCYSGHSLVEIFAMLEAVGDRYPRAQAALQRLSEMSPTAMTAFLHAYRIATTHSNIEQTLNLEYRSMLGITRFPDSTEGIRARLVDRDAPRWNPARVEDVDVDQILHMLREDLVEPPFPEFADEL